MLPIEFLKNVSLTCMATINLSQHGYYSFCRNVIRGTRTYDDDGDTANETKRLEQFNVASHNLIMQRLRS